MRIAIAILLLAAGVTYPMAALYWLNRRMARQPAPDARQVGRILALNLILPISLILTSIGLLVPRLGNRLELRTGAGLAGVAALVLLAQLLIGRLRPGQTGSTQVGDTRSSDGG